MPGRAGEAGEPDQPRLAGGHVFALMAVGARHDEAVELAAFEFRAQRCDSGRSRVALVGVLEGLKSGLEHRGNLLSAPERGNGRAGLL